MIDKEDAIVQAAAVIYAMQGKDGSPASAVNEAEHLIAELQKRSYVAPDEIKHSFLIDGEPILDYKPA
jgi:hypothetical protein